MRTITAMTLATALAGCAAVQAEAECQRYADTWRVRTVVQDHVCTTGPGLLGGLVTTCQAVPRVAYAETELGRSNYLGCMRRHGFDPR
jgi:hypothetical protein